MSYGMRRHTGVAQQNQRATMPEASQRGAVWARSYGSAIHEAVEALEDGYGVGRAIQKAWNRFGHDLNPDDLDLLQHDIETWQARTFPNTRLVLNEGEVRVLLMEHRGRKIYFRTRVDRLYERTDAPGTFIHVDLKSSKHAKSETEVRDDLQLWMTNWSLHEFFPEIKNLVQVYDQLRYGQITTRKSVDARRRIKDFLVAQATAIIEDDDLQDDGLLAPKKNQWCPWCPILESCSIIPQLTDFARFEIAALAPATQVGRKLVVNVDENLVAHHLSAYEDAVDAVKVLERFIDACKAVMREMDPQTRTQLGYDLRDRRSTVFTPQDLEAIHEKLGLEFYELTKLTKTAINERLADQPELRDWVLSIGQQVVGSTLLVRT